MKIQLIAMDLDGTLNNDRKEITQRTRSALMEAQRKGIRLALASARPSPGLFKERDLLQMQHYGGILMSYNGGRIVDAANGNVLFETAMELAQAKYVLRRLKNLPVTPIWICPASFLPLLRILARLGCITMRFIPVIWPTARRWMKSFT